MLAVGLLSISDTTPVRAEDAVAPAPPGKLYEVGGHAMHLYATGLSRPGPSVVLEAGSGAFSIDWSLVQSEVAGFAPVCSYDRAGHAWSELGPRPRTMRQAARDLHALLQKAGIRGPRVMVGHSLGGLFVRVFAAQYPDEVAGVVLVDSSMEESPMFLNGKMVGSWDEAKPRTILSARESIRDDERVLSAPELQGYRQFREWAGAPKIEEPFDRLPEAIQKLRLWAMALPQSNVTDYNDYRAEEYLLLFADRVRLGHPLGNKPLVVLTRKTDEAAHMEGQRKLLDLSGNSAFAVSEYSIHEIQLAQPELVVRAVRAVIKSIETGGRVELPKGGRR
jgi:pimeloyl-ACP methyl ester carboxylesterase